MSFNSKYKSSEIEKILDSVGGKVDKISGKQLSTEDFTYALKTKLEGLSNYDDTELSEALSTLRGDFDALVSGDTTTAIKTFNEVIAFLDGIQDSQDLSSIIASIEQQIAGKMDKVTLASVATSGDYNDLSNKPTIPTKNSQLENDSNFVSSDNLKTINGQSLIGSGDITIQGGGEVVDNVCITDFTVNELYDLIDNPHNVIQASIIELQNAITAHKVVLVPYDANKGVYGYGVATGYLEDLLYVTITLDNGRFIDLELPPNSTDTDIKGQNVRERVWHDKQDQLVSGTNIKTINGESILGSGDIKISGGSSGGGKEYVEAPLLTEPLGTSIMFTPSVPLEPNKVYVAKKKVSSINAERMLGPSDSIGAEYTIMFQASSSELPITVSSYASLLWANGAIPTIEADTYYELSLVLNNINNTYIIKAVLTPFKPVE